ncbi:utp-glnb uridylyltransferase, glnd, partial [gut metagenome]
HSPSGCRRFSGCFFQTVRSTLADDFKETGDTEAYLSAHSALLDSTLRRALELSGLPDESLVVVAVGGYGRAELYPFSDIDLLILLDNDAAKEASLRDQLESFVTWLWELKLTVGASVRSYEEYLTEAANDVSVATTYLESRVIWGNQTLYAQAREDFFAALDARRFFRDKMLELARRHQKFEDTPIRSNPI